MFLDEVRKIATVNGWPCTDEKNGLALIYDGERYHIQSTGIIRLDTNCRLAPDLPATPAGAMISSFILVPRDDGLLTIESALINAGRRDIDKDILRRCFVALSDIKLALESYQDDIGEAVVNFRNKVSLITPW